MKVCCTRRFLIQSVSFLLERPNTSAGLADIAAVVEVLGRAISVADVAKLGSVPASYNNAFRYYSDKWWNTQLYDYKGGGGRQGEAGGNYYDRARIWYREALRRRVVSPGYAETLAQRGDEQIAGKSDGRISSYRTGLLVEARSGSFPMWMFPRGLYLHSLLGGDGMASRAASKAALVLIAEYCINLVPQFIGDLKAGGADQRVQARIIEGLLWGLKASRADQSAVRRYREWLDRAVTIVLELQGKDGSWRSGDSQFLAKPWMIGILLDSLIQYYDHVYQDKRIPIAIKKALDFCWERCWVPQRSGFLYCEGESFSEFAGSSGPAPDLNCFLVGPLWWYYYVSQDALYRNRGDLALAGALNYGPSGGKQFNQLYGHSDKAWFWRGGAGFLAGACSRTADLSVAGAFTGNGYTLITEDRQSTALLTMTKAAGETIYARCEPWCVNAVGTVEIEIKAVSGASTSPSIYVYTMDGSEKPGTGLAEKFTLSDDWRTITLTGTLLGADAENPGALAVGVGAYGDPNCSGAVEVRSIKLYVGDREYGLESCPVSASFEPLSRGFCRTVQGTSIILGEDTRFLSDVRPGDSLEISSEGQSVSRIVNSVETNGRMVVDRKLNFAGQVVLKRRPPFLSGSPYPGQTLRISLGSWLMKKSGGLAPVDCSSLSFSHQWLRDGAEVPGEIGPTYNVQLADQGHVIGCKTVAFSLSPSRPVTTVTRALAK